jgi:hypothetical protein
MLTHEGRPDRRDPEALIDGCGLARVPYHALALDGLMLMVEELEEPGRPEGCKVLPPAAPPPADRGAG